MQLPHHQQKRWDQEDKNFLFYFRSEHKVRLIFNTFINSVTPKIASSPSEFPFGWDLSAEGSKSPFC